MSGKRVEVKTAVDIPVFNGIGTKSGPHGSVFIALEDFCSYLTTVASAFDAAGADRDIGLSIRTIRDGLIESQVTDLGLSEVAE